MQRFQLVLLLTLTLVLILIAGCGGNKSKVPEKPVVAAAVQGWEVQPDDNYVYLYGEAIDASESVSQDNARTNALAAKQYLENYLKTTLSTIEKEAGITDSDILERSQKVLKLVSNIRYPQILHGKTETTIIKTKAGSSYKTNTQMMLPRMPIDNDLVYQIRNDEELYNQFISSITFKTMNERVK